jgi:hypothetical protein
VRATSAQAQATSVESRPRRSPAEDVAGRAPTRAELASLEALERVAEQTRQLRFTRAVPLRIQTRAQITSFVRGALDRDELERARIFYAALGLLDPSLDIERLLVGLLGEQIVGYYDPRRGVMVIREDVASDLGRAGRPRRALEEAEMVIVHELVHALQDQALGLGRSYERERDVDADNAFSSLIEGDATLAMFGHVSSMAGRPLDQLTRDPSTLRAMLLATTSQEREGELSEAPPIVRVPLLSRYTDGMVFCAALHGQGGWLGVDGAHAQPPRSTEHILHPERFAAGDEPEPIALPPLPELERSGWVAHDEDTLGELEMSIYFGQASPDRPRHAQAAEGWGGDRIRVYRDESANTAVFWFSTWDDEAEAREAESAASSVSPGPRSDGRRSLVERRGRSLLILRDLPESLLPEARAVFAELAARHLR